MLFSVDSNVVAESIPEQKYILVEPVTLRGELAGPYFDSEGYEDATEYLAYEAGDIVTIVSEEDKQWETPEGIVIVKGVKDGLYGEWEPGQQELDFSSLRKVDE